ncbi:Disease resistance protein [Cinnamomum micranthum f. kanehirae]|uniref:Disease resistance protein n=1 Tax=Cinnamomum micranthum f. kanehirae TaxID=337451 RepID=A0A3S3MRI8_9MAGN|nr:Disease resistance protein [Cinnamomum micranthum f. kanehirae]
MAEGAVRIFLNQLCELIEKEAQLLFRGSDDVNLLREKLQWLSLSLKEADNKCLEDEEVKLWVTQVRAITFEAEDIIECFVLRAKINPISRVLFLHKLGKEIQKINSRLDNISENRSKLGLGNVQEKGEPSVPVRKEKKSPTVEEVDVVGVEDEAKVVSKMLIEGDARRSVVSIVGMGGLGKTTLSNKVFNDITVRRHFSCRAWIYVSQEFTVRDLLYDLIKFLKTPSSNDSDNLHRLSNEKLREELSDYLKQMRYLIVIDDIWNRDAWDGIQASFPNEKNGSRILLTTRKRDVALYADPKRKPYELRLLTNEECWELLQRKAFPEVVNHGELQELELVGKDIAKRCCGLPLAVVVLGGLLSRKDQSIHEWDKVRKSIGWHLKEGEDQILHILALSYSDLPYYLKTCFLYFAAFPEDSTIHATELCRMWVAEGFVQERGDETMEEVAEDYLLELIHRSLIQVSERRFNGRVKICRIHDLLRDLAIKKAKEDMFLDIYGGNVHSTSSAVARRLSITHHDICKHISVKYLTKNLRSLFCFTNCEIENVIWKYVSGRFKFLRVMHTVDVCISKLPAEIGDLIFLRYLSMRVNSGSCTLPSTLNNLYNLQTLVVKSHGSGIQLPIENGIWKMRQLKHLHILPSCSPHARNLLPSWLTNEKYMKLNELTNLQTLSVMTVGRWITGGFDNLTSLRSLGLEGNLNLYQTGLSNLIGKQENLESLRLVETCSHLLPTQIISSQLHHLKKLHLSGRMEKLSALQGVATCLTKLVLEASGLQNDPMAVLEKLPKLQLLRLLVTSYLGKKMCCSANGFPVLAVLEISLLEELEDWTVEEGAIANLRNLKIHQCSKLKMIPEGFKHVTTLQELVLSSQPLEFLERVQENGLDWFKIMNVPSVMIKR